jgi:hypothetical protein
LFLAGERCDPDTLLWAEEHLKVPVIDHWWQTETGWPIAANCIGIENFRVKPGSATKAVPGYDVRVLDASSIAADARLQELVLDADRRYGETLTNIMSRISKKRVARREYNAGDSMKLLASHLGVDGVAFVRMDVVASGKAVQALNFGMGGTQTMMTVSFIDGASADIEAYVTLPLMRRGKLAGGYDDMMKDPDVEMARYASATLDDLPNADGSARVAASDDDVLSDLESLLD